MNTFIHDLFASWNAFLKKSHSRERSLVINRAVAGPIGLIFIFFLPPLNWQVWVFLLVASAIHLVHSFSLLGAYKHGEFYQVYLIDRGLSPLLILLSTWLFGTDSLTLNEGLNICVISFGIMLLAGKIGSYNYKALLFALLTAVCISGYTIASGFGVRTAESFIVYAAWLVFISGSLFVATALYKYRGTAKLTIVLKVDRELQKFKLSEISYFESYSNYVKVWQQKQQILVTSTLKNIASLLPDEEFTQVHKSM